MTKIGTLCEPPLTAWTTSSIATLTQLFAACLVEKYTDVAAEPRGFRDGLSISQVRKVEEKCTVHEPDGS